MSEIQKVILLNKPMKIFEFTPLQWALMFVSTILAFTVGSNVPHDWKIANVGVGIWLGIIIVCLAIVLVKMGEVKPWLWWRNDVVYRLHMMPTVFMPRPEPGQVYPDPTIIDVKKRSDEYYVDAN